MRKVKKRQKGDVVNRKRKKGKKKKSVHSKANPYV